MPLAYSRCPALFGSFRHCVLRLTENNSQPLMTKLQWLFAFLEHSQVSAGGVGDAAEEARSDPSPSPRPACIWLWAPTFWRELLGPSPGWHGFTAKAQGADSAPLPGRRGNTS